MMLKRVQGTLASDAYHVVDTVLTSACIDISGERYRQQLISAWKRSSCGMVP
jgi:hemoglobin-like flavoprotein